MRDMLYYTEQEGSVLAITLPDQRSDTVLSVVNRRHGIVMDLKTIDARRIFNALSVALGEEL